LEVAEGSLKVEREVQRRLERFRDDLDEISERWVRPLGFGIITSSANTAIRSRKVWEFVAAIAETRADDKALQLRLDPWVDPAPDGKHCICWWGETEGVKAFQQWAERVMVFLQHHDDILTRRKANLLLEEGKEPDYYNASLMFCQFASSDPDLRDFTKRRTLLNLATRQSQSLKNIPKLLKQFDSPPQFAIVEVSFAPRFARAVISRLLGETIRVPRLTVNRRRNEVTIDGMVYELPEEYVVHLDVLVKANGSVVSLSDAQKKEPLLAKMWDRIDRPLNKLKQDHPNIYKVIKRAGTKGCRIRDEYLA
jgi:hypothetical protein